jgi:hypothetical protein
MTNAEWRTYHCAHGIRSIAEVLDIRMNKLQMPYFGGQDILEDLVPLAMRLSLQYVQFLRFREQGLNSVNVSLKHLQRSKKLVVAVLHALHMPKSDFCLRNAWMFFLRPAFVVRKLPRKSDRPTLSM